MDCIVHGVAESDTTRRLSLTHSLVAQLVKSLSSMRETWVLSLGWEDPLEKGMATHSNPCPENPQQYIFFFFSFLFWLLNVAFGILVS